MLFAKPAANGPYDNKQPVKQTQGHSLIISKNHFDNILEMPASLGKELLDCIKQTTIKLMKEQKIDGFNVANNNFEAAGQVVKHVHFHIIPRKKDDNLKFFSK